MAAVGMRVRAYRSRSRAVVVDEGPPHPIEMDAVTWLDLLAADTRPAYQAVPDHLDSAFTPETSRFRAALFSELAPRRCSPA